MKWIFCLVQCLAFFVLTYGQQSDDNGQFYIQTDTGNVRFFHFKTLNGQYRREKRMRDGTVIGSEGWVDAAGYLRHKDYMADKKGYRILKSKTVFVGNAKDPESYMKKLKPISYQVIKKHVPIGKQNLNKLQQQIKVINDQQVYYAPAPSPATLEQYFIKDGQNMLSHS